jgi:hypothetical protein
MVDQPDKRAAYNDSAVRISANQTGRSWRKAAGRYRQCMSAGGARRRPFNEGMGEGRYVAIRGID